MDWDHLRYFLELARAGTLAGAARRLAVEHSTVSRRIQALEKQMGTSLFAREADGHRLSEAGRQLLAFSTLLGLAVSDCTQRQGSLWVFQEQASKCKATPSARFWCWTSWVAFPEYAFGSGGM